MKRIAIGVENFQELRRNDYYYVDKTPMIADILNYPSEVTLFTRPRRFGKSLNMSMLKNFFELGSDPELFRGLAIEAEKELCRKHMGKYPVIFISLKSVSGLDFEGAVYEMKSVIAGEARRIGYCSDTSRLPEELQKLFSDLKIPETITYFALKNSLKILSEILYKIYDRKVILLIDEYDVPLDKANENHYYREMVDLIRGMFDALKTNAYLAFSVLTGCLRISKESIFTGLNNLRINTVTETENQAAFGFTEQEVQELLSYYHMENHLREMKEWYDGYLFGGGRVYCPWSVLNHCYTLLRDREALPRAYWINSSGNSVIRQFVYKNTKSIQIELSKLISGESIKKYITQELTYNEINDSMDNLWSVLFLTGYLTCKEKPCGDTYELVIPNEEVRRIYVQQIYQWFTDTSRRNDTELQDLYRLILEADALKVQESLERYLMRVISIRETATKARKENFYHGLLLGLFSAIGDWSVESNREFGDGYADIVLETMEGVGIVIEIKYGLSNAEAALAQIEEKRYAASLTGCSRIIRYGIGFEGKRCRVAVMT